MEDDRLLTVAEVADWLRVHPETVRLWLRDGLLRGFMPGGKRSGYRVRESELRRFMAEREELGGAAAGSVPAAVGSA
jgi:excisionase family DNA binding protein